MAGSVSEIPRGVLKDVFLKGLKPALKVEVRLFIILSIQLT